MASGDGAFDFLAVLQKKHGAKGLKPPERLWFVAARNANWDGMKN
jgi:hypothetical protein